MSADNLVRIKKKDNGLYQIRYEAASSLVHALEEVEPTADELLLGIVADDVLGYDKAVQIAQDFIKKIEQDGGYVEYGIVGEEWVK